MNQKEERELRENIQHLIRHVKAKRKKEEKLFREQLVELAKLELSNMLVESEVASVIPVPSKSKGVIVPATASVPPMMLPEPNCSKSILDVAPDCSTNISLSAPNVNALTTINRLNAIFFIFPISSIYTCLYYI